MRQAWWKVPVYCLAASWLCFQLEVRILGRFAIVTLPDGTITSDPVRWMILSGVLFAAVLAAGGLYFFRNMSRRERALSATVMLGINIVFGLLAYQLQGMFAIYWAEFSEWSSILNQVLFRLGLNQWLSAGITWCAPYLFVLFGKRRREENG